MIIVFCNKHPKRNPRLLNKVKCNEFNTVRCFIKQFTEIGIYVLNFDNQFAMIRYNSDKDTALVSNQRLQILKIVKGN